MELELLLAHLQKDENPFYCPNQLKTFYMLTQINRIKRNEKKLLAHEHNLDHCENTFMFNGLEYDFME